MPSPTELTAQRLAELLAYEPESGAFKWRQSTNRRIRVGDTAGSVSPDGYVRIKVAGKNYLAQRLAHLYMTGEWPPFEVDHRDSNRSNNRWGNLRSGPRRFNSENQRRARSDNASGALGVSARSNGRFVARIKSVGETSYLGTFQERDEAHAVYVEAKRKKHEGCTI